MALRRALLIMSLLSCGTASAQKIILVPSEVAVSLTAAPNRDLVPGQLFNLHVAVTNLGHEPITRLTLFSSDFHEEFDLSVAEASCVAFLTSVGDGDPQFYTFLWYLSFGGVLAPGDTRTCDVTLALTSAAPARVSFTMGMHDNWIEPTGSSTENNSATVILGRRVDPIPAVSGSVLAFLGCMLTFAAWRAHRLRSLRRDGY